MYLNDNSYTWQRVWVTQGFSPPLETMTVDSVNRAEYTARRTSLIRLNEYPDEGHLTRALVEGFTTLTPAGHHDYFLVVDDEKGRLKAAEILASFQPEDVFLHGRQQTPASSVKSQPAAVFRSYDRGASSPQSLPDFPDHIRGGLLEEPQDAERRPPASSQTLAHPSGYQPLGEDFVSKALERHIDQLNEELESLTLHTQKMEERNQDIEEDHRKLCNEVERLQTQRRAEEEASHYRIQSLEQQLRNQNRELEQARAKIQEDGERLRALSVDLQTSQREIEALRWQHLESPSRRHWAGPTLSKNPQLDHRDDGIAAPATYATHTRHPQGRPFVPQLVTPIGTRRTTDRIWTRNSGDLPLTTQEETPLPRYHRSASPKGRTEAESETDSQSTKIFIAYLENKERREREQEEAKETRRASEQWRSRDLNKAKASFNSRLTIEDLKKEDIIGIQHLHKYTQELEDHCPEEAMRTHLFKLTADRCILRLLGIHEENVFKALSWDQLKARLAAELPEFDPRRAAKRLMNHHMTVKDHIAAFAARIRNEYEEICTAMRVSELKPGINKILATAITGGMNPTSRDLYKDCLITDPEDTLKELETSFNRSKDFKQDCFRRNDEKTTITKTHPATRPQASYSATLNTPGGTPTIPSPLHRVAISSLISRSQDDHPLVTPGASSSPGRPFPSPAGEGRSSPGPAANPQRTVFGQARQDELARWRDWICGTCSHTNSAGFYTCGRPDCRGRAVNHQIPARSWQCSQPTNGGTPCGGNTWTYDHYCYGCLAANPGINTQSLRSFPATARPRARTQWYPRPPAIAP